MALSANGTGVDDVYIGVNPPQAVLTNAQALFNLGLSGGASWGPLNTPITKNTPQDLLVAFGPPINSGHDIVQDGSLFIKQQPQGGVTGVRVTDGTDTAATGNLMDGAVTPQPGVALTGFYSGSLGNKISVTLAPGSNSATGALTWKVIVTVNATTEVFDRIAGNTGATVWVNIVAAINAGSQLVKAALPATPSTTLPTAGATQTITLAGGADGAAALTTSILLGVDGGSGSRTGIYALRGTGFDGVMLAGCTDAASWSTLLAFAKSEMADAYGGMLASLSPSAAIAAKAAAGVADPAFILCFGTITYLDTYLGTNVTLPQTSTIAGVTMAQDPEQSPGNNVAYGILGTGQTMGANPQPLSASDMASLEANGIIFLAYPIPGAKAIGVRHGKNTSSNPATNEICYSRKLNFELRALSGPTLGQFVNRLQSTRDPDPLREGVTAALRSRYGPQKRAFVIDDYQVVCDLTNNPVANIKSGICRADIVLVFMSVVNRLQVNITAGQTVSIVSSATPAGQ
jgi:hypothetical protein